MPIYQYQQFINWRSLDRNDGKKPAKVPWSYRTNKEIDPHDFTQWMTFEAARATGHPIGFVLTNRDPYFFLDLDNCRIGDGWIGEAVQICNFFGQAAKEISQSGHGLHIIGQCNKAVLTDRKHKWGRQFKPELGNWLEFYTDKRFIALGPWGFEGNFDLDFTQHLLQFVPKKETADLLASNDSGPVADYTGPADDDELLQKALNSRGSIGAAFGNKATFDTLWHAKADMLAQHYPSPSGDTWDRSSADAALMAHLAFWTGKDAARMDRLFRRSGLMRAKYADRPDYRTNTISNAVTNCKKVYDVIRTPGLPSTPVPNGQAASSDGFLTIPEQQEYFKGCVYILDQHRMLTPFGLMKPEQFNAFYGGKQFIISADGSGLTKKPWEAFVDNRAWSFPKVKGSCFRPKATPGAIIDGRVNTYQPFEPKRIKGDPRPFIQHVEKMLPDPSDRATLFAYMASAAQNPGVKFQWAPVIQSVEGNGKTILTRCMEYTVGEDHSHRPQAEQLANRFNGYLEGKLFIAVEEVHMDGRRELLDTLKPLITNDRVEVEGKGIEKRMIDNFANWLFLTNHRDAILKTENDRRYAIFFCAQQHFTDLHSWGMSGNYFPALYDWLNADGFAIVADWLLSYQIPVELDPAKTVHRAPMTSSTPQALVASMGRMEQEILECVENEQEGYRGGWLSTYRIEILCREHGFRVARVKIADILNQMGYVQVERARAPLINEDLKRPMLYVRRKQYDPRLTTADYCAAQGYTAQVIRFPGRTAPIG